MSNILKSTKLDNYILKSSYRGLILLYFMGSFIGVIAKTQVITIAVVMIITAPFSGMYFSIYEKNKLNRLYGILPLGKTEVVIGRYLFTMLLCIANGIISVIITYSVSLFNGKEIDPATLAAAISGSFLFFCFFISILYPVYFKYPFSKVYIYANLPLYIIAVIGMFILKKTDFIKNISGLIHYFTNNQYMIWLTGIGLGIILISVSCSLSCFINKKNEF